MIAPSDLTFVAALCLARAGLKVNTDKAYLIDSRLAPVARREGYDSPEDFITALRNRGDARQAWAAVEAMVLPEPEFFRDRALFDALADRVMPDLAHARGGEPVRVWSAACGTGQEVYSLAMRLAEAPALAGQVDLFASDLSERSLEKAQAGLYSQFEVQRGLSARNLVRHFEKSGEAFVLSPRIRQMVRWRRVNLMDDLTRLGQFDLLLCRGLLGQLAPEAREKVLAQLQGALAPGGRLVLGLKDVAGDRFDRLAPELGLHGAPGEAVRSAA
ncbi:protein-glutamate O-methyltransferase CheR [Phenylobacterium sp.]|uniref:CheR family methyltransferase n=1 Tax=Phenylobacterium sp. TaxID=1871053 RepID=UPI0026014B1F|nr:protein-glutamate O-methyltransferase CheR [Phenylobacterium sp.]